MTMSSLVKAQIEFSECHGRLLSRIYATGYGVQSGELLRTRVQALLYSMTLAERRRVTSLLISEWPDLAEAIADPHMGRGSSTSLHLDRLAVDYTLRRLVRNDLGEVTDAILVVDNAEYEPFGQFWKSLHPNNAWGGDFTFADVGHFSRMYMGRK